MSNLIGLEEQSPIVCDAGGLNIELRARGCNCGGLLVSDRSRRTCADKE
jgi:hypothetical protein